MTIYRIILLSFFLLVSSVSFAQRKKINTPSGNNINQFDEQAKRSGTWLNKMPAKQGEPAYTEFGDYVSGYKTGLWYKLNQANNLIAIESYSIGVLDGEVKYYTRGVLTCVGMYKGLNPAVEVDTIVVEDPVTGAQELVAVKSDRGTVRHGTWKYYDEETGNLVRIEEYQVDELIYSKNITHTSADSLKKVRAINATINQKKSDYYRPPSEKQFQYNR